MKSSGAGLAVLVAMAVAAASCGKKGPPEAPLRPVPAAIADFRAEVWGPSVFLHFTVPETNLDKSTPAAVNRIDLYALTQPASAVQPSIEQLATSANLLASFAIAHDIEPEEPSPKSTLKLGQLASHHETVSVPDAAQGPSVRYYLAQPAAGRRRGPVSPVLAVPLSVRPEPPADLQATYTEKELTLVWKPSGAEQRFTISRVSGDAEATATAEPLAEPRFTTPVEFGVERCYIVRALQGTAAVTLVSLPSARVCETPVDRFPPAGPTSLIGVAAEDAIELVWTASSAADVAGYIVLRADAPGGTMQRLTPAPIAGTEYRDTTVKSGTTYEYAVVAVDRASPPNESVPSARQTVTARLGWN